MNFRELEEERARFAHDPLLDVQIGEAFERTNFLGRELGDALVNGDGFGEKTVADEDLREAFEIIDGLKRFALANVEFADGHEGDLILGLVLEDLLIFGDGLRNLALVQKLLRRFDEFTFVIGHAYVPKLSRSDSLRDFLLGLSAAGHTAKAGMTVKAAIRRAADQGQHILYATGGGRMSQRRRSGL